MNFWAQIGICKRSKVKSNEQSSESSETQETDRAKTKLRIRFTKGDHRPYVEASDFLKEGGPFRQTIKLAAEKDTP